MVLQRSDRVRNPVQLRTRPDCGQHASDGVNYHVGLVELNVMTAMFRDDQPAVSRQLRQADLLLPLFSVDSLPASGCANSTTRGTSRNG